jgi:hypothetical protein
MQNISSDEVDGMKIETNRGGDCRNKQNKQSG